MIIAQPIAADFDDYQVDFFNPDQTVSSSQNNYDFDHLKCTPVPGIQNSRVKGQAFL